MISHIAGYLAVGLIVLGFAGSTLVAVAACFRSAQISREMGE
jgi:hypothetical protein